MNEEMITNNEEFIKIVGILSFSDAHPTDCKFITDFIINLSKQNIELKEENEKLKLQKDTNNYVLAILNDKIQKENERLKNNWNELKEWLQERKFVYNITGEDLDEDPSITEVLIKLVELEKKEVINNVLYY